MFCLNYNFIAIRHAIRTRISQSVRKVRWVNGGQILQLLVSAILGTASIYSMIQNALLLAVAFMILLYLVGILFDYISNKSPVKEAKFILVQK